MNEEKDFQFKDKEIDEISAALAKANKRQFGGDFEMAAANVMKEEEGGGGGGGGDGGLESSSDNTSIKPSTAPAQTPEEAKQELYSVVKPLQTYERDMAEAIRANQESVASINLKKQKQLEATGEGLPRTERIAQKSLTIFVSLLLVVAGTGIVTLIYYFISSRPEPVVPMAPTIITTNETRTLDITGLDRAFITAEVSRTLDKPGNPGDLVQVKFIEGIGENKKNITASRLFELFAASAPPSLGRALGTEWVFGFYNASTSEPFIFTSVESFENTFSGMIKWENKIVQDLTPIFIKEGTTFSESKKIGGSNFEDTIIRSKDVRVLKDSAGNVAVLYSFLDPKNLVITTNEKTFVEILNRFFSSQIVR